MITKEKFHVVYSKLPFASLNIEEYLYNILFEVEEILKSRTTNHTKIIYEEQKIFDYIVQELIYSVPLKDEKKALEMIGDDEFNVLLINIVADKFFFNEIIPYKAFSLVSKNSPIISTMELNINFILNRIAAIKKEHSERNVLLDMFSKVFLMFKSINYLLSSGFETEAFSTWRTVHELECIIKVISDYPYVIPTYLEHLVFLNAFKDEFEDKDEQQKAIDELKVRMKSRGYKSKDMKKFIENGWLYAIKDIDEKYPELKLNFRNGIETVAGLNMYAKDYEMSSEVAHSSPLLIYSNKRYFKSLTIVRSYESFIRLEDLFFKYLQTFNDIERESYEKMRNVYLSYIKRILSREVQNFNS